MPSVNSMDFLPLDNAKNRRLSKRGLSTDADSPICEAAIFTAVGLLGFVVAFSVQLLRWCISMLTNFKLLYTVRAMHEFGFLSVVSMYSGAGIVLAIAGVLIAQRIEHVRGSGLVRTAMFVIASLLQLIVPSTRQHLRGSLTFAQPLLIAYLNGCKLHNFTSTRIFIGKFVATALACACGLCCGPEGPIIHMGACIGKQALRVLYHLKHLPPRSIFSALGNLESDEDKGIFVAIGAGAGVAAAFNAPLSGTLFVVEEAASHFSLTLLWRAFSAAMVATWATHLLQSRWGPLNRLLPLQDGSGDEEDESSFHVAFEQGVGTACTFQDTQLFQVALVSALTGVAGAIFNLCILKVHAIRAHLTRNRSILSLLDTLGVVTLTCVTALLVSNLFPCRDLTIGSLEFGYQRHLEGRSALGLQCMRLYEQCGGEQWSGPRCCFGEEDGEVECTRVNNWYSQCQPIRKGQDMMKCINDRCMSDALSATIWEWQHDPTTPGSPSSASLNCSMYCSNTNCLFNNLTGPSVEVLSQAFCSEGQYNAAASLLLQPVEEVAQVVACSIVARVLALVKETAGLLLWQALFLRGAAHALPATALGICASFWFFFSVLAATLPLPIGLMVPMMVVGGAIGRLFAVWLWLGADQDPGLYALIGATAFMAGSGQIRLFLTTVMLEVTGNLLLAPYIAAAAIISVAFGGLICPQGLYHSLINAMGLPYLPPRRFQTPTGDLQPPGYEGLPAPPSNSMRFYLSLCQGSGWRVMCEGLCTRLCVPMYRRIWPAGALEVEEVGSVMALNPEVVKLQQTAEEVCRQLRDSVHNAFPVVDDTGRPRGLLLKSAVLFAAGDSSCSTGLQSSSEATMSVSAFMDCAPCIVHNRWPLVRAHRLFTSLGLRHLLVVDETTGFLVGIITRHDLQGNGDKAKSRTKMEHIKLVSETSCPPEWSDDRDSAAAYPHTGDAAHSNAIDSNNQLQGPAASIATGHQACEPQEPASELPSKGQERAHPLSRPLLYQRKVL